jgi:hypothetical protein
LFVVEASCLMLRFARLARDQKSRVDHRLQRRDARRVALFELVDQFLCPAQNRLIDVRPEKEPNEGVLLSGPELGPGMQRSLSLAPREPGAEACPSATKAPFTIDKKNVAQAAASGANESEMQAASASL